MINTHVCRGNYHSTFFSSGAYDSVADLLFGEENVNAYYLEYDDKRSGGFAPLAKVSGDKKVVLGLITTKTPKLEDKEKVIARIHEAAKYVPLDRLYLSPQCGFASCEIGNKLTEEELAVYKRGRNAHSPTMAKHATMADYRRATGFEALMGYLYLKEDYSRIVELVRKGIPEENL